MQMKFDKIGSTPKHFTLNHEGATLEGTLQKAGYHRVSLDAVMGGKVTLDCDRCAKSYQLPLEGELKLTISDLVIEDKDDLDIIEFLDGNIDLTYILESEMNALKGEYHYCEDCADGDNDFEYEI